MITTPMQQLTRDIEREGTHTFANLTDAQRQQILDELKTLRDNIEDLINNDHNDLIISAETATNTADRLHDIAYAFDQLTWNADKAGYGNE